MPSGPRLWRVPADPARGLWTRPANAECDERCVRHGGRQYITGVRLIDGALLLVFCPLGLGQARRGKVLGYFHPVTLEHLNLSGGSADAFVFSPSEPDSQGGTEGAYCGKSTGKTGSPHV
jgi:hypothetical protein